MQKTDKAKIIESTRDDYTKITFKPDLAKFKMESLDEDIVQLMYRRAYDVAGVVKGIKVFLNGKKLPVKRLKNFCPSISSLF